MQGAGNWAGKYSICKIGLEGEFKKVTWLATGSDWEQTFAGAEKAYLKLNAREVENG